MLRQIGKNGAADMSKRFVNTVAGLGSAGRAPSH